MDTPLTAGPPDSWLPNAIELATGAMGNASGADPVSFADALRPRGLQLEQGEHDPKVARALRALHAALTFHQEEEGDAVYRPWFPGGINLDQLTDDDLQMLEASLACSEQAAYRARLNDVLWLARKNKGFHFAQAAITEYLRLIAETPPARWTELVFPVTRVAQLAASLGPKSREREQVRERLSAAFQEAIQNTTDREMLFWPTVLVEALLESFRKEEAKTVADGCRKFARDAHSDGRPRYLEFSIQALRASGDEDAARAILRDLGDHWMVKADAAKGEGAFGQEASFLEAAVSSYREAGQREQAEALIARIQDSYRKLSGTMTEARIEAPELAEGFATVQRWFDGARGAAALDAFIQIYNGTQIADARETISARTGFIFPIFPSRQLTPEGNVARRSPGKMDDEPSTGEILEHYQWAQAVAGAFLEHARQRIYLSRDKSWEDSVRDLLAQSELVPVDRRELFERALIAGMRGDGVLLSHLIIPQLENALRVRVGLAGGKTTSIEDGVMQERSLNQLVRDPVFAQVLGEDLVWEIRAFLTEEPSNLRNRVCHGLATSDECSGQTAALLLWLTLFLMRKFSKGETTDAQNDPGDSG